MQTRYYELTASEFEWQLSDSKKISAWGFNKSVPGPQLSANKGDTVVVKFKNELSEPTVIHWHGVRLESGMDGTGEVQTPVSPGEEFEYRFVVPDSGTFWYHSHHDETYQMERGMYGPIVVHEETELRTDADRVFMIDDMKLNNDGGFKYGNFVSRWKERHDGREGDTVLVNGKENPSIRLQAGQTERWRIINAASAKYFQLSLGGRTFQIIGTDGGLIERPFDVKEVLLTPGERVEILVGPFAEGDGFRIESLPYNRMTFLKARKRRYATVEVTPGGTSNVVIPEKLRSIKPLAPRDAAVTRTVKLSVGLSWKHGIDFLVNGKTHANDAPVNVGELQVWEVVNSSLMDHPFHLHGFFFQVLEVNGEAPDFISWKDTVNLPPRSKVKIAWQPDDRPGIWMYHCHILEHHEAGMMGNFEVIDPQVGAQHTLGEHHHH